MLLEGKTAVIYGGGGSIGGGVARAFAREGARLFLAGRTKATLEAVAREISGPVETAEVDALDERAVDAYVDAVVAKAGAIDISFNLISHGDVQGTPLAAMAVEDFVRPIETAMRSQFLTTRAAARHMIERGAGVILMFGGPASYPTPDIGGTQVTFDAMESLRRQWACELGPRGIRVVTLQTNGIPETFPDTGDLVADLGTGLGEGLSREDFIAGMREGTLLKRMATLEDVGNVAAFVASDKARTMTATAVNITCGAAVD